MGSFANLSGIINNFFQINKNDNGPALKNNSGIMEIRKGDDSGYEKLSVDSPTIFQNASNKEYTDKTNTPMIVTAQVDGNTTPTPTSVRHIIVNSNGTAANIGDVWWDDGTSAEKLTAVEGRTIAVTDALSGGTATFDADSIYQWDADGSIWVKIGDIGGLTGAERVIRYTIDNSATQDSTNDIPANNRITSCELEITTQYSGGSSIEIGSESTDGLIMGTGDNTPQSANTYKVPQDTAWEASDEKVRVKVAGAPAAGAGVVIVKYTNPNN